MPQSVAIYRSASHSFVVAGTFRLTPDGTAELEVEIPTHRRFLENLARTGIADADGRQLLPSDGTAFLDALLERLQSTYWHAIDGSQSPPITSISTRSAAAAR